jgi:large subunit ribosomal protein L30
VADKHRQTGEPIRVTLVRSPIGHNAGARGTLRALGLHRLHQTVEVADTPESRGMIRRVAFMLDVAPSGSTSDEGNS